MQPAFLAGNCATVTQNGSGFLALLAGQGFCWRRGPLCRGFFALGARACRSRERVQWWTGDLAYTAQGEKRTYSLRLGSPQALEAEPWKTRQPAPIKL